MADETEVYQLVVETKGVNEALKLAESTERAEKALRAYISAQRDTAAASSTFASGVKRAEAALSGSADNSKRVGQALTQLGYTLDDLQSGFRGVSNNIQPLLSGFGASGGLAGALSIAAIAAYQLYSHWDDLMDAFGMGRVRTQAEEMDALAKKTGKTADETERLLKYQRQQGIVDTQRKGLTSAETAQEKAVNAAVAEGGGDDVVKGLARIKQLNDPRTKRIDDEEAKYEAYVTGTGGQVSQATRDRFRKRRDAIAEQQDREARAELAKAAMDPGALQGLIGKVTSNPGAFGPKAGALAAGLLQATPEFQAGEAENQKIGRKADEARKDAERERAEKDAEQDYEYEKMQQQIRDMQAAKAEKKRKVAEGVQNARRQDPNLGDMLSTLIYTAAKQGGPDAANAAQVGLMDQLSAKYGPDVANQLVGDAASDAKGKYVGDMLKPEKERRSEVMDGASYARAVQAGVSNKDTPEKQLRELQNVHAVLKRILEKPGGMTD